MVATTFAADTPLAVTGLVATTASPETGCGGTCSWARCSRCFFFARLWRRAGVVTDVEFAELRYSGRRRLPPRHRALYLGLPINCIIIMGWVNLAMVKILVMIFPGLNLQFLGITDPKVAALVVVFVIVLVTALISTLSGLWGCWSPTCSSSCSRWVWSKKKNVIIVIYCYLLLCVLFVVVIVLLLLFVLLLVRRRAVPVAWGPLKTAAPPSTPPKCHRRQRVDLSFHSRTSGRRGCP